MIKYTITSRIIHWISALLIPFLFFSGWFMVDLDYYSTWYQTLPDMHQLVGIFIMTVWLFKIIRLNWVKNPKPLDSLKKHELILSAVIKVLFYLLIILLCSTGLIISTGGDQHALLGWFALPTVIDVTSSQLDFLGMTHKYMAYCIIILVLLHILAALKHHFYDRDATLRRII